MNQAPLLVSTGNPRADDTLVGIVTLLEIAFPQRLRACFLVGSYATGTAVAASDIDLVLVFHDSFQPDEEGRARQIASCCQKMSAVHIDFAFYTDQQILERRDYGGGFALTRRLLYGRDFEPGSVPLPPIELYTRNVMNGAFDVLCYLRPDTDVLAAPLDYPDPEGRFFGYERPIRLPDGSLGVGVRQLIGNVCLISSAILAFRHGRCVGSKEESVRAFRERIDDEWAYFLEAFYRTSRHVWGNVVPGDEAGQEQFREFCRQALRFERHFLTVYAEYGTAQMPDATRAAGISGPG